MAKPWKTRDYHVLLSDGTTKQAYAESQEQAETYVRRHLERIGDGRTVIPSVSGAGADSPDSPDSSIPASPGYNARATKEGASMTSMTALNRARAMGRDHGRSLASALEPGDTVTSEDVPSPLSGEWAGDPVPADILASFPDSGFDEDDILAQYEEGFYEAYEKAARNIGAWEES